MRLLDVATTPKPVARALWRAGLCLVPRAAEVSRPSNGRSLVGCDIRRTLQQSLAAADQLVALHDALLPDAHTTAPHHPEEYIRCLIRLVPLAYSPHKPGPA
jgi:hypothetical protein